MKRKKKFRHKAWVTTDPEELWGPIVLSDLHIGASVKHKDLGEGEVEDFKLSEKGIKVYALVLFDRDPPREYNMGDNPVLIEISTLTVLKDE